MLSSTNPTLLVRLVQLISVSNMTDHVRVCVHVPKERNKLDYSLVDEGSKVTHLIPPNTPYAQFLTDNFLFRLDTPTPFYKLKSPAHIRHPDESAIKAEGYAFDLSIPVVKVDPQIKVYPLGAVEVDGVTHDIIGIENVGMVMQFNHPTRKNGVSYTLDTAKGLESKDLLEHLRTEFEKLGFATTYKNKWDA